MIAVISSNPYPSYCFLLPITNYFWVNRVGHQVCNLLTGVWDKPWQQLALDKTKELCQDIHWLTTPEGYGSGTIAQVSRIFAGLLYDNEYLITSDADMLPMSRYYFSMKYDKPFVIYYSEAYNNLKYPMCYNGATASVWREVMNISGDINTAIETEINKHKDFVHIDSYRWGLDEHILGNKIKSWSGYPDKCEMLFRGGSEPKNRIDRAKWYWQNVNDAIDCHCFLPAYSEKWIQFFNLFIACDLGQRWIENYRNEFVKLLKEKP